VAQPFGSAVVGKFVRLDNPGNSTQCTISRIDFDLGNGFFLARRFDNDVQESSDHVIHLRMLAIHDGAELFDTHWAVLKSIGVPDHDAVAKLN